MNNMRMSVAERLRVKIWMESWPEGKEEGSNILVGQRPIERSTCAHGAKVDYLVAESFTALSQFFDAFGLNSSIE